jgi:hypothetical protein
MSIISSYFLIRLLVASPITDYTVTCISDYRRVILVIGFINYLQIVTTNNDKAIANSHTPQFATARIKSSQSVVSSPVVVWQRLPTAGVPLTLGFRNIPMPRLPASNSNSSQRLNTSCLTNSPTNSSLPGTAWH